MRASAMTSALVANLMDASARMRSSGSLHPAVRVRRVCGEGQGGIILTCAPVLG